MANPMPAAEVAITAELIRVLLAEQHPDLAGRPVRFLANGWDNALFRLGEDLIARLPRRALGARIIAHEQRWLPALAPRLPLPVPAPVRTGRPGAGFPYPWSVVPFLPGTPAADLLEPPGRAALDWAAVAAQLGEFLSALHQPAPPAAPVNEFRGVPLARRAATLEANLEILSGEDGPGRVDVAAARRQFARAVEVPGHEGPPLWLHGDLHPANILAGGGRLTGVIDFGDITAGDPACDLAVAWMLLPLAWHAAFRDAYEASRPGRGTAGARARWDRARGWALALGVVFIAHSADNPQITAIGRRTLAAVLGAPEAWIAR